MSELERWDRRFSAPGYLFGKEPNAFLAAQAHKLRGLKSALSVADGEGRNGVWLAEQGLDVLTIDFSSVALAKARALAQERGVPLRTEVADLTIGDGRRTPMTSSRRSSSTSPAPNGTPCSPISKPP